MSIIDNMDKLIEQIKIGGRKINPKKAQLFLKEIMNAKRIFVTGAGRSGFAAKAFAMRLMHLGLKVHAVGEATAPAIETGDLLVAVSGSGKTTTTLDMVKAAKKKRAKIVCVTYSKNSPIGKISKVIIELEGSRPNKRYKDYFVRQIMGGEETIAPLGTLFELTAMIFLDSVTVELMKIQKKGEAYLKKRHSNLE